MRCVTRQHGKGESSLLAKREPHILILGGGPGGYRAAIRAAQLGGRVTLVEKDQLGGTCLNRGCIPTKVLIQAVAFLNDFQKAHSYGIQMSKPDIDIKRMMAHKNSTVKTLVGGLERLFQQYGIDILRGVGRLTSDSEIEVERPGVKKNVIHGDKIILAMGSKPFPLTIPGMDLEGVMGSDQILSMESIPKSLLVVGGGYIGLEFATIYSKLGTKVILIEKLSHILPNEDEEISKLLTDHLTQSGLEVFADTEIDQIEPSGKDQVKVSLKSSHGIPGRFLERIVEKVLVATGRVPLIEESVLKNSGIRYSNKGIEVNDRLETSVPGIYAVGDVVGGLLLAHVAYTEGNVAAENAMGGSASVDYTKIPRCVYTLPEIASVGLIEKEAQNHYGGIEVGRFHFQFNSRALILGDQVGMIKVLADPSSGEILGVHIFGPHATELISEASAVMTLEGTIDDLTSIVHAHPTLSEAIFEATLDVRSQAIHIPPRKKQKGNLS
jgi:dihydrolipoamide dehydrogenase